MTDAAATTKPTQIDPITRAKILARVYTAILSWPNPGEKDSDHVAYDHNEEAETGSADAATAVEAASD